MAAKQTPTLLGRLVEHSSHFDKLSTAHAQWIIQHPKDAIALCVAAIRKRPRASRKCAKSDLFTSVVLEPALTTFRANDTFFGKTEVKITYRSDNFNRWFKVKVEEDVPEADLKAVTLTRSALDSEIIEALGGEDATEVTLAEIWRLMERQPSGGQGALLTNGYANIFYVRDIDEVLRIVRVYWYGGGWFVGAHAVVDCRWDDGYQVFSRNS